MNTTNERLAALAAGPIFGGTAPQQGIATPVHGSCQGDDDADDLQPLVPVRPHRTHDRPGGDERPGRPECGADAPSRLISIRRNARAS